MPSLFEKFLSFLERQADNSVNYNNALGRTDTASSQKPSYNSFRYNSFNTTTTVKSTANAQNAQQQKRKDSRPKYNNPKPPLKSSSGQTFPHQKPQTRMQPNQKTSTNNKTSTNKKPPRPCDLCESPDHKPLTCPKTIGPASLMDLVVKKKLCLNCFRPGHHTRECILPSQCGKDGCALKHSKRLHGLPRLKKKTNK